jgi:hypothetical protein
MTVTTEYSTGQQRRILCRAKSLQLDTAALGQRFPGSVGRGSSARESALRASRDVENRRPTDF